MSSHYPTEILSQETNKVLDSQLQTHKSYYLDVFMDSGALGLELQQQQSELFSQAQLVQSPRLRALQTCAPQVDWRGSPPWPALARVMEELLHGASCQSRLL